MAGAIMVCEQGLVQLGLAQKRAAFSTGLSFRLALSHSESIGVSAHGFLSEVYVIGKPLCPV